MSISVDDLVASLSSNHIGQEAGDLATLQAQLAKTLCCPSYTMPSASQRGYAQPSNTPTCRTPSAGFSWDLSEGSRARSSSVASLKGRGSLMDDRTSEPHFDDMDEDERMVEDLLCPSSPITSHPGPSHVFPTCHQSGAALDFSKQTSASHAYSSQMDSTPSSSSTFAATDPFYLAQLQAAQRPVATSFFASAGRPSPHSPFVLAEQGHNPNNHTFVHRIPVSPESEPHHLFAW
ncbi:hypothetical protein BXZ70DRAFT_902737 [Cristinia sonorae]|uniref:Uncharacterized protein n=1 Tax=Cristinia sonorae TaxID=1940300 RepID=A0A8K0UDI2_9AGAR|nr:hypothetical protein BXZ70DRAFT_902737 [Cristinia sonorae]